MPAKVFRVCKFNSLCKNVFVYYSKISSWNYFTSLLKNSAIQIALRQKQVSE